MLFAQQAQSQLTAVAPRWHSAVMLLLAWFPGLIPLLSPDLQLDLRYTSLLQVAYLGLLLHVIDFGVAAFAISWSNSWEGILGKSMPVMDILLGMILAAIMLIGSLSFQLLLPTATSPLAHKSGGLIEKVAFVSVWVIGGCSEEVVYRGYWFRQLQFLTKSTFVSMVLQTLVFLGAHGFAQSTAEIVFRSFLALILCWVVVRTNRLLPAIVAHGSMNAFVALAWMSRSN
jgi:membrane protease YdiL (CAAX protease family)